MSMKRQKEPQKIHVSRLRLYLNNYRVQKQNNEIDATKALIKAQKDKYEGLLLSIIDNGYDGREQLLVLQTGDEYTVYEGNRRTSILKLITGNLPIEDMPISTKIKTAIKNLTSEEKQTVRKVSCLIYSEDELDQLKAVVSQIHSKGEPAARQPWNALAKSRYDLENDSKKEYGLRLLQKFLDENSSLSEEEKKKFEAEYPTPLLNELITKLTKHYKLPDKKTLINTYPALPFKDNLDEVIIMLGKKGKVTYRALRQEDFLENRGLIIDQPINMVEHSPPSIDKDNSSVQTVEPKNTLIATHSPMESQKKIPGRELNTIKDLVKSIAVDKGVEFHKVRTLLKELESINENKAPNIFAILLRTILDVSLHFFAKKNKIKIREGKKSFH